MGIIALLISIALVVKTGISLTNPWVSCLFMSGILVFRDIEIANLKLTILSYQKKAYTLEEKYDILVANFTKLKGERDV